MSSEVCPFCGKTYKRLKSHLPHCKAATSSKTPPAKHDVKVTQTSSSRLATALTKPTAEGEKSTQSLSVTASPQPKKSKKVSVVSTPTALQSEHTPSSSQSLSQNTATPPPSTKKKKEKLSKQIKTSTATIPVLSTQSQSPSVSPTISKPKKKSLHALIEATKSKPVSKGTLEEITSTSGDLPSGLSQFVADPLNSRITAQTETKTNPDKDFVKDDTHHTFLSTDTKPKGASKMKVSKTKTVAQDLPTAKDTSSSLDSGINMNSAKPHVGEKFLEGSEEEFENLSVNRMFLKSRSGHQARITLNDVKATLGRANATRQPSILSQILTTNNDLSSKVGPGSRLSPVPVPTGNQETSPTPPLPSTVLLSQVSEVRSPPQTVSMNEGLKVGHHMTGLPTMSPSLTRISSHHLFPLGPQTVRVEILRANNGLMMEKSQLGVRKQNTFDNGTKDQHLTVKSPLTQQSLGQVRLKELPEWLAYKAPRHPSDAVKMVQRGWQWYYKKYIDVKKGGIGGLSMLLAGYCVLSYIWSYPHIKRDRWRKHH